jgi:CO/xanthine dehydrogenase Mo-binding subunit
LKVDWEPFAPALPGDAALHDAFRKAQTNDSVVVNNGNAEPLLQGARVVSASYRGPYQSHGTMAPNCALADVTKDAALIMCSDQAIYQTRSSVAQLLGLPAEKVRVQFYSGSNTFGSSCYVEVALAAALMSKELGKPVRVQLSRGDELGWDNYGPAHLADVRGAVDRAKMSSNNVPTGSPDPICGAVGVWRHACSFRPERRWPIPIRLSQNDMYDIPNRRMIDHRVPGGYLRIGALRAPLDPPYFFAQEGMMDELAYLARLDPYEFRKRNISHPRWLGVLKAATDAAKWAPRIAASNVSNARIATGRGSASERTTCP